MLAFRHVSCSLILRVKEQETCLTLQEHDDDDDDDKGILRQSAW
jgi:hypothetical protein